MREIKFRAWNKKNKVMRVLCDTFYWIQIGVDRLFKSELSFFATSGYPKKELLASTIDGDIFMQYTGLKDKNGKEIYEGDIVLCSRHDGEDMHEIVIEDIRQLPQFMFGSNLDWREVIGNIYENPELIK